MLHQRTMDAIAEYFRSGNSVQITSRPMSIETVQRIAMIEQQEERADCIKICESISDSLVGHEADGSDMAADAIRGRK